MIWLCLTKEELDKIIMNLEKYRHDVMDGGGYYHPEEEKADDELLKKLEFIRDHEK